MDPQQPTQPPSQPPSEPPQSTPPTQTPVQKRILLVEDEDMIRELYARQLGKAGFWVKAAPTGEAGLEALKTTQFDMLLLDIMLPGINGLQVLREYRMLNPNSPMIVIMLTNLGQESVIKEGFDLGAAAYLIKTSYTPDQIIEEVRNYFNKQAVAKAPPAQTV